MIFASLLPAGALHLLLNLDRFLVFGYVFGYIGTDMVIQILAKPFVQTFPTPLTMLPTLLPTTLLITIPTTLPNESTIAVPTTLLSTLLTTFPITISNTKLTTTFTDTALTSIASGIKLTITIFTIHIRTWCFHTSSNQVRNHHDQHHHDYHLVNSDKPSVSLQVPLVKHFRLVFSIYLDEYFRSVANSDGLYVPCHLQLLRGHFQRDRPDGDLHCLHCLLDLHCLLVLNSARFALRLFRIVSSRLRFALP